MKHLRKISTVVYLQLSYNALKSRLGNLTERGVSFKDGQTLKDLYDERVPMYEKYADLTVEEMKKSINKIINEICERLQLEEASDIYG